MALQYDTTKDNRLEVVMASYERILKHRGEFVPSLMLPQNSKDLGLGSWSGQKNQGVLEPAIVEIQPPTEKARTNDFSSAAEVISPVSVKAPRRKLRRPTLSRKFKLVASLLSDFDSSLENGETEVSTSLVGTIGVENQACTSPMLEDSSTAKVTRAEMMSNTEEVVTLLRSRRGSVSRKAKLRCQMLVSILTLTCLSRKGGEENARVELKVGSDDDDMDFEDDWKRGRIFIISSLTQAKMHAKKKFVAEDLSRGDEVQTFKFQRLVFR
ncbi:hypothetical protein ACFE04_011259 [Oxalis oulophora]